MSKLKQEIKQEVEVGELGPDIAPESVVGHADDDCIEADSLHVVPESVDSLVTE